MNRVFCLETEWTQTVHDLKKKSTVLSLLEFMNGALDVPYVFRQVAALEDFDYYICHLQNPSYDAYDVIYLCFHGSEGSIHFADKSDYTLKDFAIEHKGIFKGRTVIFDSCSTLKLDEEDLSKVKRLTGARMIVGYTKSVDFVASFVFEFWLLNVLRQHPGYASKRLMALAEEEMPLHVKRLGFICY